jgi:hypothetical protein
MTARYTAAMLAVTSFLAACLALPPSQPAEVAQRISPDRLLTDVATLANFGTRHTLSDTESPTRGIGAARRWIKAEFEKVSPHLEVRFEEFDAPKSQRLPNGARVVNVVAVLPGSTPQGRARAYYVVGHYDSRNADAMDAAGDAPGANDDASGTAVVLEIARALQGKPLESTVVFLCTAAEEQGLVGAAYHAAHVTSDKPYEIMGVLNNDIVGDPWGEHHPLLERDAKPRLDGAPDPANTVRVFSEGIPRNPPASQLADIRAISSEFDSPSRQLARFVAEVADRHAAPSATTPTTFRPTLVFRPDRFLRGGDHSAFNERGIPAVRFTVVHEDYSRQHANVTLRPGSSGHAEPYGDVTRFVDAHYMARVARLNAMTLVHLANAPAAPKNVRILTKELVTDTTLKWSPNTEPDLAGYSLLWRATTDATWTHSRDLGNVTEITVPLSKDNLFFGVRAIDKDGYMSPVTFAGSATE